MVMVNKKLITVVVASFILTAVTSYSPPRLKEQVRSLDTYMVPVQAIATPRDLPVEIPPHSRTLFLEKLGHRESSNNYLAVNRFGYMGKYQFGKSTLKTLGYTGTYEQFLNTPGDQERAVVKLLYFNKKSLQKFINKYEGKVVNGVYITESGILAAAHLVGSGNVRKFFRSGKIAKDAYGTSIEEYMTLFRGYDLQLNGSFTKF